MTSSPTVLISGASLAGPALAYWLNRYGFTTTVVERAPAPRFGGYKIDIRGAAVEVVRRMGILDQVREHGTEVRHAAFVNGAGRRIASMDGDLFGGRTGDDAEILRGDLARLVHGTTLGRTEYRYDDSIATLEPDADGVLVGFQRGPSRRFDLVVGADGVHSHTRSLVFDDHASCVRDLGHHISVFSVPNHLDLDREEVTYAAAGRTALMYATAGDTDATAMFLFRSPTSSYDRRDTDAQRALLAEAYAGAGWEVPRLLDAARHSRDFYFDRICQVHLEQWWRGRVALVGDAAYCPSPASGQGSSLALVGAYVLAGELAAAAGDHEAGFAGYQARMRDFVTRNQTLGPDNLKTMVMGSRAKIWFQLRMLKLMPHLPGSAAVIAAVADRLAAAANAITLPDYPTAATVTAD